MFSHIFGFAIKFPREFYEKNQHISDRVVELVVLKEMIKKTVI